MNSPPPLPDELRRIQVLRQFEVLDTPEEEAFDELTALAAQLCETPSAFISLIDEDRQWFKSRIGIPYRETRRSVSFCAHTIHYRKLFTVPDATLDQRFADNPAVIGEPRIRFYAGAPLITEEGSALGTLAVVDDQPRTLTEEQERGLVMLARQTVRQLESRRRALEADGNQFGSATNLRSALRAREEKLRAIFDAEPECVKLLGADGILHEMNAAGLRLIEAESLEDVKGKSLLPLVAAEDREACTRVLEAVARGERRSAEFRIVGFKGAQRWMEMTAVPLVDEQTGKTLVLAVSHDVTEHRRLEEQFRHAQKMEAIGQLAGGVAHDFNNLLTVIQGNAALLQESVGEIAQEHVQDILQAADRAASLTRQLLLFSRKQVMQPAELDLNEAVGKTIRMLRRILGEDIALHAEFSPELPLVLADAGMIEQVLLNLAINARDAMFGGGCLFVSTSVKFVDDETVLRNPEMPPGLCACLVVSDTGTGIPSEVMPHIFEPFFTSKEVGKGTGLGLATVYGIVKQHRGWIEVESEVGKGALFRILLPAISGSVNHRPAPAPPANLPVGNETLLVVEDEPSLRSLTSQLLRRCGYEILAAQSGNAALALWNDHKERIRLLLTDVVLPGSVNGHQLAEILQKDRPQLRVVFTSGYSTELSGSEAFIEGVNFLQKPFHAQKLAQIVRDALDKS